MLFDIKHVFCPWYVDVVVLCSIAPAYVCFVNTMHPFCPDVVWNMGFVNGECNILCSGREEPVELHNDSTVLNIVN